MTAPYRELIARFGRAAYVLQYVVYDDLDEAVILRIWPSREQRT